MYSPRTKARDYPIPITPAPGETTIGVAELARLRRIEVAAAAYRLTYEQQHAQIRDGAFTFRAEDYNARNRVRAALFAALDEQH